MGNSDFIIDWIDKLYLESNELEFVSDDIRYDFFGLYRDISLVYYRNFQLVELSILINQGKIDLKDIKFNKHINSIQTLIKIENSYKSHFNSLNRHLIVEAWSIFEICLNTFCKSVLTETENQKLLSTGYNDIKKILGKTNIDDKVENDLKEKYVSKNLTHIAITRKTDAIFKKVKGYSRNIEEDKKFLLFFGRLRNSMHSNYIYYGKSFKYKFGHSEFIFKDGEIIKWSDPFKETPKLYFYLIGNLKNIWKAVILSISHEEIIYYPDLKQE